MTEVHGFVDEGLGHSSSVIDLGDGTATGVTARVFDGRPDTWSTATGRALAVGR